MLDIMKTFDGNFFVAVTKEDKVVGTIGFRENPENNTFEVLSVSVDRIFRKKGIASKMMTEMEKEADKRGRNVFVTTTFQNVGACGLYRSRGYIESRLDLKRYFLIWFNYVNFQVDRHFPRLFFFHFQNPCRWITAVIFSHF